MGTGIVSDALLRAGAGGASVALLIVAGLAFLAAVAASAWHAAGWPEAARSGSAPAGSARSGTGRAVTEGEHVSLGRMPQPAAAEPGQAIRGFCFVAACSVLVARLTALSDPGPLVRIISAVLAAAAAAGWLAVSGGVLASLAGGAGARLGVRQVDGAWYLWVVGTQALAIAAVSLAGLGLLPARVAGLAAVVCWPAGLLLYLVTTALVAARLLVAGLTPDEHTAPYWVSMGAASISVLAATEALRVPGVPSVQALRAVVAGTAVMLWGVATCLLVPLLARSLWRHLHGPGRLRYRPDLWMAVFPAGMYATASKALGAALRLPLVSSFGSVAVWPATAIWAGVFGLLAASMLSDRF
jgi:tellurite resistance protein TehA-like permease